MAPVHRLLAIAIAALPPTFAVAGSSPDDASTLAIYLQLNSFDIETSLLARAQASSESLRMLAEHVVSDHLKVRQAALALATQCSIVPALPAARLAIAMKHDEELTTLLRLHDKTFDEHYLQHDLAFHREAIDTVRNTLLPSARCTALVSHLTAVLPAFEEHLAHTQALADGSPAVHSHSMQPHK
jgi:putative membrane protein